jgi:nicotinamidase-related amidase
VPELGSGDDDILLDNRGWSAFADTDLDDLLRGREITQVVLVGLATIYGIESTARQAYDLGYHVVIVGDAINNPRAEGHEHSMTRVFPALAQVCTTDEILTRLSQRFDVEMTGSVISLVPPSMRLTRSFPRWPGVTLGN